MKDLDVRSYRKILEDEIPNLYDYFEKEEVERIVRSLEETDEVVEDFMNEVWEKPIRRCSECGKLMIEGYCIEDGFEYFCSDGCLYMNYTKEEFMEMYDEGEGSTYYTKWE